MTLTPTRPSRDRAVPARRGVGFVHHLGAHGDRPALVGAEGTTTYAELAALVTAVATRHALRVTEPLVLPIAADLDDVVTYLGCLAAGRPVILTDPDGRPQELESRFAAAPGGSAPHPDLALLLSTSGSTGSPRLVRLSAGAVSANALSIAEYLDLRPGDVGITALPLHYCYGLSVLHSHLAAGAAVVLTGASIVDPCFWDAVDRHAVTTVAGVPHSFAMLEAAGVADRLATGAHPSVRALTQAGGRMAPSTVRQWAERGERGGFDLVVMYGQTEATARMAYLPGDLAATRPDCVGVPVPGGDLRIEPVEGCEDGVGELVYTGPNVMMGYAESRDDLARGHDLAELRTGDLGCQDPDGLWRVVGRRSRFAKVLGLRIDLDRVESALAADGIQALVVEVDERLVVAALRDDHGDAPADLGSRAARLAGVPDPAVCVVPLQEWPLLPSGKPDRQRVAALARRGVTQEPPRGRSGSREGATTPAAVLAEVLGRPVGAADSFASLGGDSLSYVEASVRLERVLGTLPDDWHLRPVGTLEAGRRAPRGWRSVDTSLLLRALAIVAVVSNHANLSTIQGGAHFLLVLVGFNLGRFALSSTRRSERVRAVLGTVARVAVPSVLWIGGVALVTGQYPWQTALLVNAWVGPAAWAEPAWWFWFIEAMVWCVLALAVVLAVPALHRLDLRHPFAFPVALVLVGLLSRYDLVVAREGTFIHRPEVVWWLVALGLAAARAGTVPQRVLVSALAVATLPGFFDPLRAAVVVGMVLALVWVRRTWVPAALVPVLAALAAASLWIYLTHWQVYPHLEVDHPLLATLSSLVVGVAAWWLVSRTCTLTRHKFVGDPARVRG